MDEFCEISTHVNLTGFSLITIFAAFCLYRLIQALLTNKSYVSKELSLYKDEKAKNAQGIFMEHVNGYDVSVIYECVDDKPEKTVNEILKICEKLQNYKFEVICMISPSVTQESVHFICAKLRFPEIRFYLRDVKFLQGFIQGSLRARGKYIINYNFLDEEIKHVKDEELTLSLLKTNSDRIHIRAMPKKYVNTFLASIHFIGFLSYTEIPVLVKKFNISPRVEETKNEDSILVIYFSSLLSRLTSYLYNHRFLTTTAI